MEPRDEFDLPRKRRIPGPTVNGWLVMILLALVIVLVYRAVRRHNQLLAPEASER